MHHYLNIATKAARSAGKILSRQLDRADTLKGPIDKMIEEEIIAIIQQAYPHHAILGKETGHQAGEEATWIIDPLSGSTNFMNGYPAIAISMAIQQKEAIEHALVYDPIAQELFTATRGNGAQLNGRRLRVSKHENLNTALIGTLLPQNPHNIKLHAYLSLFQAITLKTHHIRQTGSPALDLAQVAAGRLEGYFGLALQPWEIAAGILLIREAGGFVGDFKNEEVSFKKGQLIAGNRKIYPQLLPIIQGITGNLND